VLRPRRSNPTALVLGAGLIAGAMNTVVGSGTLITFPVLMSIGLPPVAAKVANNVGLAPGSRSGALGYRGELSGSRRRAVRFSLAALAGGAVGALLLLVLPPGVFSLAAPILIALALVLVIAEPWGRRRLREGSHPASPRGSRSMIATILATSAYGGYFGAGRGVILLAVMALLMAEPLQQINALKNLLQAVDNAASALLFVAIADIDLARRGAARGRRDRGRPTRRTARPAPSPIPPTGGDRRHRHRRCRPIAVLTRGAQPPRRARQRRAAEALPTPADVAGRR
jgi:uncharacterized protein